MFVSAPIAYFSMALCDDVALRRTSQHQKWARPSLVSQARDLDGKTNLFPCWDGLQSRRKGGGLGLRASPASCLPVHQVMLAWRQVLLQPEEVVTGCTDHDRGLPHYRLGTVHPRSSSYRGNCGPSPVAAAPAHTPDTGPGSHPVRQKQHDRGNQDPRNGSDNSERGGKGFHILLNPTLVMMLLVAFLALFAVVGAKWSRK